MATTQLHRIKLDGKQIEETESSMFQLEVKTEEQSLVFVKKLVAVSLSTITYLRMIFPEISYKDKNADGLQLKMLMDESGCPGANKLISWINGCFDAIEKKYLREMTLAIYTSVDDPLTALETYTFKFSYDENGNVCLHQVDGDITNSTSGNQKYEVKKPTLKLIRTLIMLMQSLESLPEKVFLSMKLHYYEERTPHDYEPPGFCPAPEGAFSFKEEAVHLKVGHVPTPFHAVKLRVAVDGSQFPMGESSQTSQGPNLSGICSQGDSKNSESLLDEASQEENLEQPHVGSLVRTFRIRSRLSSMNLSQSRKEGSSGTSNHSSPTEHMSSKETTPKVSPRGDSPDGMAVEDAEVSQVVPSTPSGFSDEIICHTPIVTPKLTDVLSNQSSACSMRSVSVDLAPTCSKEFPVRCPCKVNSDDGLMIMCDVCGYWQHGACFTILEESQAPSKHFCEQCADPSSMCTDPRLCWANTQQVEATCLYRRTLVILRQLEGKVSSAIIAHRLGVDISVGTKVVEKLTADQIIATGTKGGAKMVDKEVLKSCFLKYFNRPMNLTTGQDPVSSQEEKNPIGSKPGISSSSPPQQLSGDICSQPSSQQMLDSQMSIDVLNVSSSPLPSLLDGEGTEGKRKGEVMKSIQAASVEGNRSGGVVSLGKSSFSQRKTKEETERMKTMKENVNPFSNSSKKSKLSRGKRKLRSDEALELEVGSSPVDVESLTGSGRKRKKASGTKYIKV